MSKYQLISVFFLWGYWRFFSASLIHFWGCRARCVCISSSLLQ